jgi:hypothetical protein
MIRAYFVVRMERLTQSINIWKTINLTLDYPLLILTAY